MENETFFLRSLGSRESVLLRKPPKKKTQHQREEKKCLQHFKDWHKCISRGDCNVQSRKQENQFNVIYKHIFLPLRKGE